MSGPPDLEIRETSRVGLLTGDYRGIKPELLCEEGDRVRAGEAVFCDRRRPEIRVTAPHGGRIAGILRGSRRKLLSVQIEVFADAGSAQFDAPVAGDAASLRAFMLETGAWSTLRTRPFGNVPAADAEPAAIFVSALDNEPGAPPPQPLIDHHADAFAAAVEALAALGEAPVYVCHAENHLLSLPDSERIRCVAFGADQAAGRPGVHIHQLCPIGFAGGEVWQLGYQEAIALGWLLQHGSPWLQRMISLSGNGMRKPRSLLVAPGAALDELLEGEVVDGTTRVIAGSALYGRRLVSTRGFLAARQRQLTALVDSEVNTAGSGVLVPGEQLEALAPPGIFAVPLMRALQLGDAERARELGALELLEEDLAPLSQACVSRNDYGELLRRVLDDLEVGR